MHRALSDYLAIPMAILSKSHLPISSSWPCSGLMDDLGCGSLRGQRPQFWSWEGQLCCPLVQSHQLPCQDWLPFLFGVVCQKQNMMGNSSVKLLGFRLHLCDYICQVGASDTTCNGVQWVRVGASILNMWLHSKSSMHSSWSRSFCPTKIGINK